MKTFYITTIIFFPVLYSALLATSPTPIPHFPSDAEIKKIPASQIRDTLISQDKLIQTTQAENTDLKQKLIDTNSSQNTALKATSSALTDIVNLRAHDTQMTNLANKYGKELNQCRLHSFLNKIISIAIGIVILGLVILWFTGKLALFGSKIASKIP